MPQHSPRAASAGTAHRGITTTVTVPGRSVGHDWNSTTNRWVEGTIGTHTYDARANATQIVYTDSVTSQPRSRELYTYNLRNQVTESTYQSWLGSAYVNEQREQYAYDAQGNITLETYQTWNGTAWTTQSSYRTTNTYNSANVLTSRVYEELNINNNTWQPDGRITFTLNSNNQWSEAVYQEWSNGAYVNDERTRNITWYDWSKLLPSYLEDQEWVGGAWVDDQRSTITYQPNGSNVEVQQQSTAPNTWVNDDRITTTYDNFGNLILDQYESWNSSNTWVIVGADRTLLSYTAANQVRRAVEQDYNTSLNRYVNSYVTTYSNFVTLGTRRASGFEATATLHPNPTTDAATISLRGLREQGAVQAEVLNTLGQVVQTFSVRVQQGGVKQQINLASYPAGVYTVRLHTTEGTVAKRVVKQ
ncbi:T9SS type A sorting domain-containing protein [Hymenobacter sp. BT186]|uniref:T9SS type A sorting domain-containing protein n=1 Tax=Hymenobacter telluris TaxID=2816474 RepID=A0A939EUG4_9BACT|nr:T9SS type A sorting domain-containing protein [Hymenobacter telluris]MBO0357349.1 T9SS type A sorting domain-containing protein [Hymenobacter telluris]MBW3373375.1 T9SS type A sorting domain-containing protein [Hymenobacter norwichensis]